MTDTCVGIPVVYWAPLDGWMAIEIKQIRNPNSEQIVWMKPKTWKKLADHASRDGIFYIPCEIGLTEVGQLRRVVGQMEQNDAKGS